MHFGDVFKAMVKMVIVQLQWAHCFHFLFAALIYAKCHNLLLMLYAAILLPLIHYVVVI